VSALLTRKRAKPRRVSVLRDRGYLDWISAECTCVVCWLLLPTVKRHTQVERMFERIIDPAHGPVNGRGSKGADNEAIPLCRTHHDEQHQIGWSAFDAKYGIDRAHEARTHYAAYLIWKESQA
jgi:hypothetical protein